MTTETQLDYSAVEQALAQNEANSRMRIMAGKGVLAGGVMLGLGGLAIAAAWAWQIAKDPKIEEKIVEVEVEKIVEVPAPQMPQVTPQTSGTKIVRNYVIFQQVDIENDWRIETGHEYGSSEQIDYDYAWCHARGQYNDIDVRIHLSNKMPSGDIIEDADFTAAKKIGLTSADLDEWKTLCPYL